MPDIYIDESFDLTEYGFDAKILHIPGHTKVSIGIFTSGGDFISGDIFSNAAKPDIAMNAADFKELRKSIGRILYSKSCALPKYFQF